jgi:hypothetical protein
MWPFHANTPPAPAEFHDPDLGQLRFSEGDWIGTLQCGKHHLSISIAGNNAGPDHMARQLVADALPRMDELFDQAVAYQLKDLSPEELSYGPYVFRLTGIWSGAEWQLNQLSITLTMELEEDEYAIWRVEMGPNGPLGSGRDS